MRSRREWIDCRHAAREQPFSSCLPSPPARCHCRIAAQLPPGDYVGHVAFLDTVLDDVARRVDVDPARIYIVGESNGAMLARLYAAVRSNRIAGVAAVIGTIGRVVGEQLRSYQRGAEGALRPVAAF